MRFFKSVIFPSRKSTRFSFPQMFLQHPKVPLLLLLIFYFAIHCLLQIADVLHFNPVNNLGPRFTKSKSYDFRLSYDHLPTKFATVRMFFYDFRFTPTISCVVFCVLCLGKYTSWFLWKFLNNVPCNFKFDIIIAYLCACLSKWLIHLALKD